MNWAVIVTQPLGVRRPVGALIRCDLSHLPDNPFLLRIRRQDAEDESADRSAHSNGLSVSLAVLNK